MEPMTPLNSQSDFCIRRIFSCLALVGLAFISGCTSGTDTFAYAPKETEGASDSSTSQLNKKAFHYRLTTAPSAGIGRRAATPAPIALRGRGTAGRIVSRQGNTVMTASQHGSIYGLDLSPNHNYGLVYFGDATYKIINSDTLEDIASPPQYPPTDDDVTGFRWFFLDDTSLFGLSQLRSTDTEGRMASEIDSLLPRATLAYVYVLKSETLMPVEIDDTLPSIFSIDGVSNGQITLLTYDDERIGATIIRTPDP